MSRPHTLSLTDQQLALVQRHSANLPLESRDRYLRSIADGLIGKPSDAAVLAAINRALDHVHAFQESQT